MNSTSCKDKKVYAFQLSPRCGARTKRNHGRPCKSPAVRGKKRCRIHGGSMGSGAPRGNQHALKHGQTTAQVKAFKKQINQTLKQGQEIMKNNHILL